MIAANEIRIGNWFLGGWKEPKIQMQVTADHLSIWFGHTNMAQFPKPDPIPLTPEILIACGFEKLKGSKFVYRINTDYVEISVSVELNYVYFDTLWGQAAIKNPIFKHLHQLQNIYYALCGEELIYKP